MADKKTLGQKLEQELFFKNKELWEKSTDEHIKKAFDFCERYKTFLNSGKTERECVATTLDMAKNNGFVSLEDVIKNNKKISQGDKIYSVIKNKSIILCVIGEEDIENGVNIIAGHIDAPRIDLKQNPLYESTGLGLMKTHYYGGIKKYQWVTIPLALHGVVVKENGEVINICIGENENDPVFTITDLLPHLAQDQMTKKMSVGITGEELNLVIGSIPYKDEKVTSKIKLNILNILYEKYQIKEEDLISSEFEIVPAFKARDVGLDRSLLGSYGQDDRVCSYISLEAILSVEKPKRTCITIMADKEEIGSVGNTGAASLFIEDFFANLCHLNSKNDVNISLRKCLNNSRMLSADVCPAVDPTFPSVHEKQNSAYLGKGIVFNKFTGSRGKSGANDASAEFLGFMRSIFNKNEISWQIAELGKVDQGGGGTIAQFVANLGVEVIDCGVPILSMHSPFEITSKIDIYETFSGYKVFFTSY